MSKEEFWMELKAMDPSDDIIKYAKEEEKDIDDIYTYYILFKNITEMMYM